MILSLGHTTIETKLTHELQARGFKPVVVPWADVAAASAVRERRCISLVELEKRLLDQLSDKDFSRLVDIMKNALSCHGLSPVTRTCLAPP